MNSPRTLLLLIKRLVALLAITFLCAAAAEIACRSFWHFSYGVPFSSPDRLLYAFYPELLIVDNDRTANNGKFNVLILGGSALHPGWGYVDQLLRHNLFYGGHEHVRVYNLAFPAHTSRDSLLKYAALGNERFDLVILYHGVNSVRANNVSPELYRDNFDHYGWYEIVNALSPYHLKARYALPYSVRYLWLRMKQTIKRNNYISAQVPRREWTQYGEYARSVNALRQNISRLLSIASRRGDRVLLLTSAIYVPDNYSYELFRDKALDYNLHLTPIELWGRHDNVEKTVELHNEVIRGLAKEHKEVLFLDMAERIPRGKRFFNDLCHLTQEGSKLFADSLFNLIVTLPTVSSGSRR